MGSNGMFGGGPLPGQPGWQGIQNQPSSHQLATAAQLAQLQNAQLLWHQQQALIQMQVRAQQWVSGSNGSVIANSPSQNVLKPDPSQPDTLGWREWLWSPADKMIKSPSTGTLWPEAELVVPAWDDGEAVRGVSGIHAHLVPKHWKILGEQGGGYVTPGDPNRVHGIVERFGKYVLGTEGWRAEWVIIKELMAPSTAVGLEIEQAYPDVIVHYPDEEGDESCTLATLSKLGKGSRSTSRPKPSPQPSQLPSPSFSQVFQPSTQMAVNQSLAPNNQLLQHMMNRQVANSHPSRPPAPNPPHLYVSLSSSESEKPISLRPNFNDVCAGLTLLGVFAWLVLVLS
jgi:hypothetical protein